MLYTSPTASGIAYLTYRNPMIRFLLLQNRAGTADSSSQANSEPSEPGLASARSSIASLLAGKTRLAKYYIALDDGEKRGLEYDVHKLIATRDPKHTNFVEVTNTAASACHE